MSIITSLLRYVRSLSFIIMSAGLIMFPFFLFSQNGDDPNLDQLPRTMWNNLLNKDNPETNSTVITIDNWDNFNLGVDFGESNIAANLDLPTNYFTAYNTNTGHHTENGLNWVSVNPNFGTTMQGDPVVAYDSLGNLFYENMYGASSILGVKVIKSTDNGATWGSGVTAVSGGDKCWLACDQTAGPYANYVYACMTSNTTGGNFGRSTDHGATFTTTFSPTTQSVPGMMVCVGPNNNVQGGSVFVVTNSGTSFASIYTFYRSTDGGQNFTQMSSNQFSNYVGVNVNGRNSVSGMRTRPYPMIAADNSYGPHRGRLYLVYASNDPPGDGNKPDIWCRYSDDGGATFSPALIVNDDANTHSHNQFHPAIWCDKNSGKLYVQWMDDRDTPTNDSAYIYASYSGDGGVTFAPNQRISNQKMKISCPTCGGSGTPRYQGDYNGIYSNRKVGMAGWTDFRLGSFMSATAYFPDFAMSIDHNIDTLFTAYDSAAFSVSVPEVKLYSDTVIVSGTITPVPTAGTITFEYPFGNSLTSFPGSVPVTIRLTGDVPVGNYQAHFFAKGPNGTPVHERIATLRILAGNALYVLATATPSSICAGATSQLSATPLGGTGPYTYVWAPTTGLSDPNVADPTASPLVNTWYHVTLTDGASRTATDSVLISILPLPATPGLITGPSSVCVDTTATYQIAAVIGATSYSWTVPAGAAILSGQNTTTLHVQWGATGGNISVIAGNNCGNSNPNVKNVSVITAPGEASVIKGPDKACSGSTVGFSVSMVPEATYYSWTVPADASITAGEGTDSISVHWGMNPGDVSVTASNDCGSGDATIKSIGMETLPVPAGAIGGSDTVCSNNETYTYTVGLINGATSYVWNVPSGVSLVSGGGTNSIVVSIGPSSVSGLMTVQGKNTCGAGAVSEKDITVKVCSGIQDITKGTSFSVYPNPAANLLNLVFGSGIRAADIRITDISGQTVYRHTVENITKGYEWKVEVSGYARGVYFVEMSDNQHLQIKKVILE